MTKRLSGFTLIELLIVVAIIAILAAIAVPNFLEAQTRSKVSRVKADHRSLATAIEAYYLDNNAYPMADTSGTSHFGANFTQNASAALRLTPTFRVKQNATDQFMTLTTPVAYITSLFSDPFADTRGAIFCYAPVVGTGMRSSWITWSFGPDTDEGSSNSTIAGDTWFVTVASAAGEPYIPETQYSQNVGTNATNVLNITYDPSNGTTSNGDVWRVKQ